MMEATEATEDLVRTNDRGFAINHIIPPGLESLAHLDHIGIHQIKETIECLTGWEFANKYELTNQENQTFLWAREDTGCCNRQFCGPCRSFQMHIWGQDQDEVIRLERPLKCSLWCFGCCLQSIEVQAPPGTPVGTVTQEQTFCTPFSAKLCVRNTSGDVLMVIQSPCCTWSCGPVEFQIYMPHDDNPIGTITKYCGGCTTEVFYDADTFSITFPKDMEVRHKTLLIGALFLIDYMFFERSQ